MNSEKQYSLKKILTIWAAVAIPMPILAFIVAPALYPYFNIHNGIIFWICMIVGMAWQTVVSIYVLYNELGTLQWSLVKERIWLNKPFNHNTGKSSNKYYWWLIPGLLYVGLIVAFISAPIENFTARLLPFITKLPAMEIGELATEEFIGAWWIVGIALISSIFNYFIGEELLFRGVLLPKMNGVFGKYDWVVNNFLFALYHLHKPVHIIAFTIDGLSMTFLSKRFKSNWFAVIIHGVEGIILLVLVLGVVTGLAFK